MRIGILALAIRELRIVVAIILVSIRHLFQEAPNVVQQGILPFIQENGVVVKDLDIGLIDFPTLFRGEEVYLCWKLGETGIRFWHGLDEGFRGRKPIDEEFLANHRGE